MKRNSLTIAIALLALSIASCGIYKTKSHPNAIDSVDGTTYDALTIAQATLDEAKAQYAVGKLPANAKSSINAAGDIYNAVRAGWISYRDVRMGLKQGDLAQIQIQLQADLRNLAAAVAELKKLIGGK